MKTLPSPQRLGGLSLLVLCLYVSLVSPTNHRKLTSPFAWRFYLTENYTSTFGLGGQFGPPYTQNHLLGTADCPTVGCQFPIYINFTDFRGRPHGRWTIICFLYDQTRTDCKTQWCVQNVGCPWSVCNMHGIPPPTTPLSDPSERLFKTSQGLTISIPDPWDPRWTSPVKGAMYGQWNDPWPSSHIYIWRSYVQVQTKVHAEIQHQETILTNQITSHSFSWLNLLRGGIQLANLTGIGNLSACLLCATLGRPRSQLSPSLAL